MIEKPDQKIPNGCIVDIEDRGGAWAGRGIFNGHSRISLRILTTNQDEPIDEAFFDKNATKTIVKIGTENIPANCCK